MRRLSTTKLVGTDCHKFLCVCVVEEPVALLLTHLKCGPSTRQWSVENLRALAHRRERMSERADVLSAMLRIAENEIRSKDEQIALLHEMVATNEQEIQKKDSRIGELEAQLGGMQAEVGRFKALFSQYLLRAEVARNTSVFARAATADGNGAPSSIGAPNGDDDGIAGDAPTLAGLPPPTCAALVTDASAQPAAGLPPGGARASIAFPDAELEEDTML